MTDLLISLSSRSISKNKAVYALGNNAPGSQDEKVAQHGITSKSKHVPQIILRI